jgi:hypothetical protein
MYKFQVDISGVDLKNRTGNEHPYLLWESQLMGTAGGR